MEPDALIAHSATLFKALTAQNVNTRVFSDKIKHAIETSDIRVFGNTVLRMYSAVSIPVPRDFLNAFATDVAMDDRMRRARVFLEAFGESQE